MKNARKDKLKRVLRRATRTRAKMHGTAAQPRLTVNRSLKHIRAQVINDDLGVTLASASDADVKEKGTKTELAAKVGTIIAERAKAAGIETVVFDRGSNKFHGRVKAVAEAARESGLKF